MNKEFEFLLYRAADEDVTVNAVIMDETIWLNQRAMAELFGCSTDNISLHLKNIFAEGELDKTAVTEKISATAADGKKYQTQFYNLDAIISVGYRVNSKRATHFRIWATGVLKEYMTKGFALDDERLKQGKTAAEIIYTHADRGKENMGLTTWKHAPEGRILKSDVSIAKNYLDEKQIRQLERTVTGYFDYIEDLIERENTFTMEEFAASINEFLAFRRYDILPDRGRISSREAKAKAETEYDAFNKTQKVISDFDREVKKMLEKSIDAHV